jgi:glutamate-1-semialdehyde 2,1-aminomutase
MNHRNSPTSQSEYRRRAKRVFGGGALSIWSFPDEYNVILDRGEGSRVWDVDGREYIDYHLGSGPLLLGHRRPEVDQAVARQLERGSTFNFMHPAVIELAETVVEAVPCAETVKFVSTGTEATMYALRLARSFTGRSKILKFAGALHGGNDYAAQSTFPHGTIDYPKPVPDSGGIPEAVSSTVLLSEFNNLDRTEQIVVENNADLAGIIVEPLQRALAPAPGFLDGLRRIADRIGAVLIFDEIVTGFRLAYGGAQERYEVQPDIAVLGKALASGFPVAAIAGRRDIMDVSGPGHRGKPTYSWISGTFNGNPIGTVAGLAGLGVLRRAGVYDRLHHIGGRLRDGLNSLGLELGIPLQAVGEGPLLQVFFTASSIDRHVDTMEADSGLAAQFGFELIKRGILVNPGQKMYLSLAHTDDDLSETLAACRVALQALLNGRRSDTE